MDKQGLIEAICGMTEHEFSNVQELELEHLIDDLFSEKDDEIEELQSEIEDLEYNLRESEDEYDSLNNEHNELIDSTESSIGLDTSLAVNENKMELISEKGLDNIPLEKLEEFLKTA